MKKKHSGEQVSEMETKTLTEAKKSWIFTTILDSGDAVSVQKISSSGTRGVFIIVDKKGTRKYLKTFRVPKKDEAMINQIKLEYTILPNLNFDSPHFLKVLDHSWIEIGEHVCHEFLYEDGGEDLLFLLQKCPPPEMIVSWAKQSAEAMLHVHKEKICHSDIKPGNMVYKNGRLCIIDFGSVISAVDKKDTFGELTLDCYEKIKEWTPKYWPPEFLTGENKIPTSLPCVDVYCWGMAFYQIISNLTLVDIANEVQDRKTSNESSYNNYIKEKAQVSLGRKKGFTDPLLSVLSSIVLRCLSFLPKERPTFKEIFDQLNEIKERKGRMFNFKVTTLELEGLELNDEDFKEYIPLIRENKSLRYLSCGFNEIGKEGAKLIKELYAKQFYLQSLVLHSNKLGSEGAKLIGELLKENVSIEVLDLQSNDIQDTGAKVIGAGLEGRDCEIHLLLGDNNIRDDGCITLAEILFDEAKIVTLYLDRNKISTAAKTKLVRGLSVNESIKTLCIEKNLFAEDDIKHIRSTAEKRNIALMRLPDMPKSVEDVTYT